MVLIFGIGMVWRDVSNLGFVVDREVVKGFGKCSGDIEDGFCVVE